MSNWIINEEQARKIIETEPIETKDYSEIDTTRLSKEEREKLVKRILEKWQSQ